MCRYVSPYERRDGKSRVDENVRASRFELLRLGRSRNGYLKLRTSKLEVNVTKESAWIGAAGLGAGLMYLSDPDRGKRRRALVRDQAARSVRRF